MSSKLFQIERQTENDYNLVKEPEMTRQVGIFAGAEQFRDSLISNLVYQSCIRELLEQSHEITAHLDMVKGLDALTETLTTDLHRCEAELEEKWEKASLLYEGVC